MWDIHPVTWANLAEVFVNKRKNESSNSRVGGNEWFDLYITGYASPLGLSILCDGCGFDFKYPVGSSQTFSNTFISCPAPWVGSLLLLRHKDAILLIWVSYGSLVGHGTALQSKPSLPETAHVVLPNTLGFNVRCSVTLKMSDLAMIFAVSRDFTRGYVSI